MPTPHVKNQLGFNRRSMVGGSACAQLPLCSSLPIVQESGGSYSEGSSSLLQVFTSQHMTILSMASAV